MDLAAQARLTPARIGFAVAAVLVFIVDRVSKGLVNADIRPGTEVQVLPFLWFDNAHNAGAAFGFAPAGGTLFLVAEIAVAVALVYYVATRPQPLLVAILLGLVAGGTVGNGYDRLVHGSVTDFIAVHWWPVFNLADSAISVGVVALVTLNLLRQQRAG